MNMERLMTDTDKPFVYRTRLDDLREFREFIDEFEACFVCVPIMTSDEVHKALDEFLGRAAKLLRPDHKPIPADKDPS